MSSVFLCHSHADKEFAKLLAADLRASGHSVWIDEAEINVGDSLIEKIREGLDQVDYVAAILSSASTESEWVKKELEIASNREIEEKRVIVLPLLVESVPLPGFLKGKFYADFTTEERYIESLQRLLRKLGPENPLPPLTKDELLRLRKELESTRAEISAHKVEIETHRKIAMKGKSPTLVEAIEKANETFPQHAPINSTYAFEVSGRPVTLDYLMWATAKAERRGSHPLEILLTLEDKWGEAEAMISAYSDMIKRLHPS